MAKMLILNIGRWGDFDHANSKLEIMKTQLNHEESAEQAIECNPESQGLLGINKLCLKNWKNPLENPYQLSTKWSKELIHWLKKTPS